MIDQPGLIDAIAPRVADLPGLKALFVAGSFGRGDADAVSDVDLVALAEPDAQAPLAAAWRALLENVVPVVFWSERHQPVWLLNAISEDWLRCDLSILHPMLIAGRVRGQLRVLFDPDDLAGNLPETAPDAQPQPRRIAETIDEFLRILGLLPVVAARGEWIVAATGSRIYGDGSPTCCWKKQRWQIAAGRCISSDCCRPPTSMRLPRCLIPARNAVQ